MKVRSVLIRNTPLAVMCAAVAVFAQPAAAAISDVLLDGAAAAVLPGPSKDVRTPPTVSAAASGQAAYWVRFQFVPDNGAYNGAVWRVPMTGGSATMPVMPSGRVRFWVEGGAEFDAVSETNAVEMVPNDGNGYGYTITEAMPDVRQPDMHAWASGAALISEGWRGTSHSVNDGILSLPGHENPSLAVGSQSSIRTRQPITAATLYFKARYASEDEEEIGVLAVEMSSSASVLQAHTLITDVEVLPATTEWHQYKIPLNLSDARYLRIRHKAGVENGVASITIRDIVITDIPADVNTTMTGADHEPGYPSASDPTTFRVQTVNVSAVSPASNISPKLIWRHNEGGWNTVAMRASDGTTQGEAGDYEVTLPPLSPGRFDYYYRTDFTGYAYSGLLDISMDGYPIAQVDEDAVITDPYIWNDKPIWIDRSGTFTPRPPFPAVVNPGRFTERRSPSYHAPEIPNAQLYDHSVWPPRALNDGSVTPVGAGFAYLGYNVRRFRSMHDQMSVNFTPFYVESGQFANLTNLTVNASYPMIQVGDYTWMGIVYQTNAISVNTTIRGTRRYNPGATEYESADFPRIWGEEGQDETARNPPMAGFTRDDDYGALSEPIKVQIDYDGFLMFRFCTTNGFYDIRRAAWQDFNTWQADNRQFTTSFGLFETDTYESSLAGRDATVMKSSGAVPFELDTRGDWAAPDNIYNQFVGQYSFVANRARRITERTVTNINGAVVFNRAVRISTDSGNGGVGSFETTGYTATPGRDTARFRVRVSSDNDKIAYYRNGFGWAGNDASYTANAIVEFPAGAASVSPANPSVSLYGWYQDEDNYIEGRMTQVRNAANNGNEQLRFQLWQKKNGALTLLGGRTGVSANNKSITALGAGNGPYKMSLKFAFAGGGGSVFFQVDSSDGQILQGAGKPGNNNNWQNDVNPNAVGQTFAIDAVGGVPAGGTVGVGAADCLVDFKVSVDEFAAVASSQAVHWYTGGNQLMPAGEVSPARWQVTPGAMVTLRKNIPVVKYRIGLYRTGESGYTGGVYNGPEIAPAVSTGGAWDYNWDPPLAGVPGSGTNDLVRTASSYSWNSVSVPMHVWDNAFIRIEPLDSDGGLVIDDFTMNGWRGEDVWEPDSFEAGGDANNAFNANYAVVVNSDGFGEMQYELNRTRADPREDQCIVSPLLNGGIGDLLFNYTVTQGNVSFVVETLDEGGASYEELFAANVTAANPPVQERCYVPALVSGMTGKMRIRVIGYIAGGGGSSSNGVMLVDNLKATNYPVSGDTSWEAYNARVSTYDWVEGVKFDGDGEASASLRSAEINNAVNAGTPLGVEYDADAPYFQSPRIDTGIGEVAFWYRMDPDTGLTNGPGRIYLKAATALAGENTEWKTFGVADLNPASITYQAQVANMESATNIDNSEWRYFSVEFFAADYKHLRIYGEADMAGGEAVSSRVLLDNIIVTEPVRSSIDFGAVNLVPAVPLKGDMVGIDVRLANPRMNPYNIDVYLMYWPGTNVWGRDAWEPVWDPAVSAGPPIGPLVKKLAADPDDRFHFTLSQEDGIAGGNVVDAVVQYALVATYEGTFPAPVYYGEQFANPEWYEPVDLNDLYGGVNGARTPYYFVLSIGTNSALINEFLPYGYERVQGGKYYGLGEQFVELIGQENGDISGWRLEHVDPAASANAGHDVVTWFKDMKPGAKFTSRFNHGAGQAYAYKNWGLYVLANNGMPANDAGFSTVDVLIQDEVLFPDSMFIMPGYTGFINSGNQAGMNGAAGALVLRRSMGAIVDRVVWGDRTSESVDSLIQRGYKYAGKRDGVTQDYQRRPFMLDADSGSALALDLGRLGDATPGYFNSNAEAANIWELPPLNGMTEPEPMPELAISIADIEVEGGAVVLTIEMEAVNEVQLSAGSGFSFYVEATDELPFGNSGQPVPDELEFPSAAVPVVDASGQPAPGLATGDANDGVYRLSVPSAQIPPSSRFFRIKAVPPTGN